MIWKVEIWNVDALRGIVVGCRNDLDYPLVE
jgi:hypothetical protein